MSAEGDAGTNNSDPYTRQGGSQEGDSEHGFVFWADEIADEIERRVADQREATDGANGEKRPVSRDPEDPIVIKGGISPSGVPHLGNMNEIMRGYFVAEVLRECGHEVRQLFTADDRDPLRKLPRKLANSEGTIVRMPERWMIFAASRSTGAEEPAVISIPAITSTSSLAVSRSNRSACGSSFGSALKTPGTLVA